MIITILITSNIFAFYMAYEPIIKKIKDVWILEYNSKERHNHRKKIKLK